MYIVNVGESYLQELTTFIKRMKQYKEVSTLVDRNSNLLTEYCLTKMIVNYFFHLSILKQDCKR